jgi:hypothetical protein
MSTQQNAHTTSEAASQAPVLPPSAIFRNPRYYIMQTDPEAARNIMVPNNPYTPNAHLLHRLATIIEDIPSAYQEINLIEILALDYFSCSRRRDLGIGSGVMERDHEEWVWRRWRGLRDCTFNIQPPYRPKSPTLDTLSDLARVVWLIDEDYHRINLANIAALNILCNMRAVGRNVRTGIGLRLHNKYVEQMWWSLREY